MEIQSIGHSIRVALALGLITLAASQIAVAQDLSCPLANEKPMLVTQLFFGLNVKGRNPVTPREWEAFLRENVTPRFPDGFTVYDGYGQWLDPSTHVAVRENSKIMILAAKDTAEVRARLAEVSNLYREAFHQQAVGMITSRECGAF